MFADGSGFYDDDKLQLLASRCAPRYQTADPFPHIGLSGLFPDGVLDEVVREIDRADYTGPEWRSKRTESSVKRGCSAVAQIGSATLSIFQYLESPTFLKFLERLTGIAELSFDATLNGGGVHMIERGGFLDVHADFNHNEKLQKYRRLNLLVYLNRDWLPEYGGDIELWDVEMKACRRQYPPAFNHCVIFTTSDVSYHGHPAPLACPDSRNRKSLACYYYTVEKPADIKGACHKTRYQETSATRRRRGTAGTADAAAVPSSG